jgi:hypothetical protein
VQDRIQPLDKILSQEHITNHDLVKASQEQLTYKQVQKARRGKLITGNIQGKITRALNRCLLVQGGQLGAVQSYTLKDLFGSKKEKML